MSSGIYSLNFPSGKFYIGKSNNIERRWEEHAKKIYTGTAAKNVQMEFNKEGTYRANVLHYCHPDHLDILETYYINYYWGSNILNTTRPPSLTEDNYEVLLKEGILQCSTFTIVKTLLEKNRKVLSLDN
jgi:group I intron endonuclease